jgi:hypothetical protein
MDLRDTIPAIVSRTLANGDVGPFRARESDGNMVLTNSEVACFQRCEREWQHRYVDHLVGRATAPQSRGTRVHAWLAAWWGGRPYETEAAALEPVERAMVAGYAAFHIQPHLAKVQTNVPFKVELPGVTMVGSLDVLGADLGRTVIVEHKTTSQDITPGSQYWSERVHCDSQVSAYLRAFPGAIMLYDVLRVPALRPLETNSRRKAPETDQQYVARCMEAMAEEPGKYFQRGYIVRLDAEHAAFEEDLTMVAESMHPGPHPRNPKSCFSFGKRCDFFGVCWQGERPESLPVAERNHTEEMLAAYESSFVPLDRLTNDRNAKGS